MSCSADCGCERWTAPITSPSYGSAGGSSFAHADDRRDGGRAMHRLRASPSSATARRSPSPTSRRRKRGERRRRRRRCTAVARHLSASNALTLIATICACGNSECEPVVKSDSRVPIASTRSASCASVFAAVPPVTPMGPACSGWSHGSALLPACVSATGHAMRLGERAQRLRAAVAVEHAATGDDHRLLRRAQQLRRPTSSSAASGNGARMRTSVGAKNASG